MGRRAADLVVARFQRLLPGTPRHRIEQRFNQGRQTYVRVSFGANCWPRPGGSVGEGGQRRGEVDVASDAVLVIVREER